MNGFLRKIKV